MAWFVTMGNKRTLHKTQNSNHNTILQRVKFLSPLRCVPGDNTGAIIEVTCIREGGERTYRIVAGKFGQAFHKIIQLVQAPAFF